MTEPMFDLIAVYCFAQCGHVVREMTPDAAHAAMEAHYQERHAALITALAGSAAPAREEAL